MYNDKERLVILGAGSWGTALAVHVASAGTPVLLWARDEALVQSMAQTRVNQNYLPDVTLPPALEVTHDFEHALSMARDVLLVLPSVVVPEMLERLKMNLPEHVGFAWAIKGLVQGAYGPDVLSVAASQVLGQERAMAMLAGPSFAQEVVQKRPTATVIAGNDEPLTARLQSTFHHDHMRVYTSQDLVGVQLCGVIKNVLSVACGVVDGLTLGANARSALLTRGIAEMQRLLVACGGDAQTLMGLAGIGDIVLSCTSDLSRNRRFGLLLGRGVKAQEAEQRIGGVVEGYKNVFNLASLGRAQGVELPITEQVEHICDERVTAMEALQALLSRDPKAEF